MLAQVGGLDQGRGARSPRPKGEAGLQPDLPCRSLSCSKSPQYLSVCLSTYLPSPLSVSSLSLAWAFPQDKTGKNVSTSLGTVTCARRGPDDDKAGLDCLLQSEVTLTCRLRFHVDPFRDSG